MYNNYTILPYGSQVAKIKEKLAEKKNYNEAHVISWLLKEAYHKGETLPTNISDFSAFDKARDCECANDLIDRAHKIAECATYIGITNIDGIAKIVNANFCRERLCAVCMWRRQAKFLAQTMPMLPILGDRGYRFIFITLTLKNVPEYLLRSTIDVMMSAWFKLLHRVPMKKSFKGVIRSLELTYNEKRDDFHPHIHALVAVDKDYFENPDKYISTARLSALWAKYCGGLDYEPHCSIEAVRGDKRQRHALEVIKYSLKPDKYDAALSAFYYCLKGRRLVSFSGVFAKLRQELKLTDFENILTDDLPDRVQRISAELLKFDVNGGTYKFVKYYQYDRGKKSETEQTVCPELYEYRILKNIGLKEEKK